MRASPEPTQMEHLSDASFLGKLLVLSGNVRLDWKEITRHKHSSLLCHFVSNNGKKSQTLTPGVNVIKLFSFVADDEAK